MTILIKNRIVHVFKVNCVFGNEKNLKFKVLAKDTPKGI